VRAEVTRESEREAEIKRQTCRQKAEWTERNRPGRDKGCQENSSDIVDGKDEDTNDIDEREPLRRHRFTDHAIGAQSWVIVTGWLEAGVRLRSRREKRGLSERSGHEGKRRPDGGV
jgi:hypothetical protein